MKNKIPLLFKAVYVLTIIVAFVFIMPMEAKEKTTVNDNVVAVNQLAYNAVPKDLADERVVETFAGQLTGYGPNCTGCSGKTAYGYDVRNGNIYYEDKAYGEVRIVAADKKFTFGTIVRITAPNVSDSPIVAVVLDRGSAITGNKFDLLYDDEKETKGVGRQKNVKYEVLRYGW